MACLGRCHAHTIAPQVELSQHDQPEAGKPWAALGLGRIRKW